MLSKAGLGQNTIDDRPKLLDLFCGAGGCAMGYYHAGFADITGVDLYPQKNYPFRFIQGDALEYLASHGHDYDVIHASPPCQRYSEATPMWARERHPDLIPPVQKALRKLGKPYIIENVENARHLLRNPIKLCGSMLGLAVWRHRYFEISPDALWLVPPCCHNYAPALLTTAGSNSRRKGRTKSVQNAGQQVGIDWMSTKELTEAVPPAYTQWIGERLIEAINPTLSISRTRDV